MLIRSKWIFFPTQQPVVVANLLWFSMNSTRNSRRHRWIYLFGYNFILRVTLIWCEFVLNFFLSFIERSIEERFSKPHLCHIYWRPCPMYSSVSAQKKSRKNLSEWMKFERFTIGKFSWDLKFYLQNKQEKKKFT